MPIAPPSPRRPWRRLSLVAAAFPPLALAFVAIRGAWKGWEELHPARAPLRAPSEIAGLPGLEDLALETEDGVVLRAWWRPGELDAAVVLAHGWGSNREQMLEQATALAQAGFGVLLLDLRGHGASGGRTNAGDGEELDVRAATDHLAARQGIRWLGAVGYSLGGIAVGAQASGDPRIRAVVVEGAPPTLDEELEALYGAGGPGLVPAVRATMRLFGVRPERVRLADELGAVAPRPVLLVYGERDELTAPGAAARIRERAGAKAELWIVPGATHGDLEKVAGESLARRVVAFMERARADEAPASGPAR
ncbi:MAG TPA: alpha/beta fold hydrolase [Anaeromyxobacteraceae bacterium]|nr:alpha/beta fold hydrolase [Anaeromyxobacteraceae bacterium]